jgi:hypothetical protein
VDVRTGRRDLAWLGGLVLLLLIVFLWPYVVDGYRFGVGPDVPVYLWWTRVGASEGLSAIGSRPGAPALAAALAGTLQLNAAAVTAGLAAALGVGVGEAAAGLVRAAGGRGGAAWVFAGLLAGVFSVHLVAGYLANLILAVCFLAAAAALAGERRTWWAAALLLAGGGIAHPPFLVHAIVVLLITAVFAWRAGARDEARDIALSVTAGGLVAGAGVLATMAGPGPITAETSKDGYLRRAGLDSALVDAFRERFRLRAARYVQWIAVPLAVLGTLDADGFLRRFLGSWLGVIAVAIPIGWITGWFPPDRIVTFGFAVPIAAAISLVWILRRHHTHPRVTRVVVVFLAGWMIVCALLAWGRQRPFVSVGEANLAQSAALLAARNTPPGTPVVFLVDDDDSTATFLGARAANILRAAAPPGRAGDVYVVVASATDFFEGRPTERGDVEYDALSRMTFDDVPGGYEPVVFVLAPFYRNRDAATDPRLTELELGLRSSEVFPTAGSASGSGALEWGSSSPGGIATATIGILVVLTVLGLGYARTSFDDLAVVLGTAPAFGAASLSLTALLLDRLGLRLHEVPVAIGASTLAGLGGLALFLVVQRQRASRAPSEVEA